jgi:hypothetical protein
MADTASAIYRSVYIEVVFRGKPSLFSFTQTALCFGAILGEPLHFPVALQGNDP